MYIYIYTIYIFFQADHMVVNKQLMCSSGESIAPTLSVIQLPAALCVGLKPHKCLPLHWHSHRDFNSGLKKAILIHESSLKITGKNKTSFSFAFRDKVKMLVNEFWKGKWDGITCIIIIMLNDLHDPRTSVVFKGLGSVLKDKLEHCVVFKNHSTVLSTLKYFCNGMHEGDVAGCICRSLWSWFWTNVLWMRTPGRKLCLQRPNEFHSSGVWSGGWNVAGPEANYLILMSSHLQPLWSRSEIRWRSPIKLFFMPRLHSWYILSHTLVT